MDFNEFTDGLARPRSIWLNNDGVTSASFAKSRILKFCFSNFSYFFHLNLNHSYKYPLFLI